MWCEQLSCCFRDSVDTRQVVHLFVSLHAVYACRNLKKRFNNLVKYPLLWNMSYEGLCSSSLIYCLLQCESMRMNTNILPLLSCATAWLLTNGSIRLVYMSLVYAFDGNHPLVLLQTNTFRKVRPLNAASSIGN